MMRAELLKKRALVIEKNAKIRKKIEKNKMKERLKQVKLEKKRDKI